MPRKEEEPDQSDRATWSFGQMLRWHLDQHTQPEPLVAKPWQRRPWKQEEFAQKVNRSTRALRLWLEDKDLPMPDALEGIERVLFGEKQEHEIYRRELRAAYDRVRQRKTQKPPQRTQLHGNKLSRLLDSEKVKMRIERLSSELDAAEHPLLKQLAKLTVEKFFTELDFDRQRSPAMTHQEFAFHLSKYVMTSVIDIKAFSRSTVTNWQTFNISGHEYLCAQKGKHVTRVFVLASVDEYNSFMEHVFPSHEKMYGASSMFVCSERTVSRLISTMPASCRIGRDEDFAIFDDSVVAFCSGKEVRIRTDNVANCLSLFTSLIRYLDQKDLSYAKLKGDCSKVYELL